VARARATARRNLIGLRGLNPAVREAAEAAIAAASSRGLNIIITSAFRSLEQQAELRSRFEKCVATGRFPSPPDCKFPANRPGDSGHNFGLAWDSVVAPSDQDQWDAIREAHGFRVPPNDRIHAEVPDWRLHKSGDIHWSIT